MQRCRSGLSVAGQVQVLLQGHHQVGFAGVEQVHQTRVEGRATHFVRREHGERPEHAQVTPTHYRAHIGYGGSHMGSPAGLAKRVMYIDQTAYRVPNTGRHRSTRHPHHQCFNQPLGHGRARTRRSEHRSLMGA